jgi:serine phosphatase RsbU (regulator of sigma subunit)/anti-sigma regulatory factor (Ser/Thr protein kinase)
VSTAGEAWEDAPCGLLTLRLDGSVLAANRTLLGWLGRSAADVVGQVRVTELLSVGGRIYWETHLSPLLHVDRRLDEVAVELTTAQGRLPVLLSALVSGEVVHLSVTSARERSRYERELLAARAAAERSEAQVRALQTATAALSQALGVVGVADALLAAAVGPLGAGAASLWLADTDGALALHGARNEPVGTPLPLAGVVLQGSAAAEDADRVVVPLHGTASLQGVLSVAPRDGAAAEALDLEVLTAVGLQAGLALDRAQLHQQSADVAHELQHSLLALELPDDNRFAVATAYRPGVELLEVGGDWYDVFLAEDGVLSVVVGDVVGRGLGAASAMGQLRSAVRAVAGPEVGPARLLSRLDRFVEQVEAASLATLAYAELDLASGRVRYACAGHPPPVLLPATGEPRLLWGGRSTPLGAFVHPEVRDEAQVRLAPGDRLLVYTDGLVERRDRALDESLDVLRRAAGAMADVPLADAVTALTETLLRDEQGRDDVCVLLLSWAGPPFQRRLTADLTELSDVRRALAGWLAGHRIVGLDGADLVLAASEVVANAAEHGGGGQASAHVDLSVRLEQHGEGPDEMVVQVTDQGRWREPSRSDERGRGLRIVELLVDDVAVQPGDGTTVVLRRRVTRGEP